MSVVRKGKPIMTYIVRGIRRLCHTAQGKGFYDILRLAAPHPVQKFIERLGNAAPTFKICLVAQLTGYVREVKKFLLVGLVVDAVDKGLGLLALGGLPNVLGNGLVCQQHKLLYKLVRLVFLPHIHAYGASALVYVKTGLGALKGNGAIFETLGAHLLRQRMQGADFGRELPCVFGLALYNFLHLLVIKTAAGVDDGSAYPIRNHLRLFVYLKHRRKTEFVLVGTQGTQAVA